MSLSNCNKKLDIIDSENILVKYSDESYNICSVFIRYFNGLSPSYYMTLYFFNLQNFLEIKATQKNKIFENIELSIKSIAQIKSYNNNNLIRDIQCSKKLFFLAEIKANFTNIDSIESFNFNEIISKENYKIFLNKNIGKYHYNQIHFEKYVNDTKNFLYLEPIKIILGFQKSDHQLNFTFINYKSSFENIFKNYFKVIGNYDLDFIYTYVSCKICLSSGVCDYSSSNVLEFNITDLNLNLTQNFNKTNNHTYNPINNVTDQISKPKNDTKENNTNTPTSDKLNGSSIIEDFEKNSTKTLGDETLILFDLNKKNGIYPSLELILKIQNSSAQISTTPLNNFTYITDMKTQINTIKLNADLLDKLNTNKNNTKQDLIKETININLILSKINCSNTSNIDIMDNCKSTKEYTQGKILSILKETFDCNKIKDAVFRNSTTNNMNYLIDPINFLNSVASVYISSMNLDSFSDKNINMINEINNCLLKFGPDLLEKTNKRNVNNDNTNQNKTRLIEDDFFNMMTTTSSNMIKIAMLNNDKEIQKKEYNGTRVNDLVVKIENLNIKETVERNSLLFLRLNKDLIISNKAENLLTDKTESSNKQLNQLKLITDNLVFYSKRSIKQFNLYIIKLYFMIF